MKKLLTLTAVGAILSAPATAVQKCVALNSSDTTCTSSFNDYSSKAEWEATCTTNGTSVPIKGVGVCSNVKGSATGAIYSDGALPTVSSATDTTNKNCWCKMTSPAVSSWVFFTAYSSAGLCAFDCAPNCAGRTAYSSEFRSALFSNLSD